MTVITVVGLKLQFDGIGDEPPKDQAEKLLAQINMTIARQYPERSPWVFGIITHSMVKTEYKET